jgi:alpha-ketoglutarate-dependent taurine dioxygenase
MTQDPGVAGVIATKRLSTTVGAEVLDVDRDRLLHDPDLPDGVLDALEEHGVLVFPQIGVDDEEQVEFGHRLGELVARPGYPIPEINVITQTPDNPMAEYLKGNAQWHIDGALDDIPSKAGILSARVISAGDSGTEFASTYAAYDDLDDDEQARLAGLRVIHSMEATLRDVYDDPTPEQLANWRLRRPREHPLVWQRRTGRKSLVLGSTADYVVDMDLDEGRALLADLVRRATRPERVAHHDWTVGDMVIWDNTGVLHRVTGHDPTSTRELHRATLVGDEPVQ